MRIASERHQRRASRGWKRRDATYRLLVLVAFTSISAFCLTAHSADQIKLTTDEIARAFDERIFFSAENGSEKILAKWTREIRFGIYSDSGISPPLAKNLNAEIAALADATKHPMVVTTQNLNFMILVSSNIVRDSKDRENEIRQYFPARGPEQFIARMIREKLPCGDKLLLGTDKSIVGYLLIVSTAVDPAVTQACVADGLKKGMGFLGNVSGTQSTFNFDRSSGGLSELEEVMLGILYDPQIKTGSSHSDGMGDIMRLIRSRN